MLYQEVVLFHCCVLFPNMNLLSQFVCYTVDGYLACQLFFFFWESRADELFFDIGHHLS